MLNPIHIPSNLSEVLEENCKVMDIFIKMDDNQKNTFIQKSKSINTKVKMEEFVSELTRHNAIL